MNHEFYYATLTFMRMARENPSWGEQLTRLRVLRGGSPRAVNCPIRTASMSDASLPAISSILELQGLLKERTEALEVLVLTECLQRHQGNKTRVAKELGLSRNGLMKKMQRYSL